MAGIAIPGGQKSHGRRRRARKARPVRVSRKVQLAIRREIYQALEDIALDVQGVQDWLAGEATPDQAMAIMAELGTRWGEVHGARARRLAGDWVGAVNVNSKAQLERSLADALGVDFAMILDDQRLMDAVELATQESVMLIRSIPEEYLREVSEAVLQNFQQLPLPEGRSLVEQIQHIYDVSQSRATLIARDQTSKINTALTQARYEEVGIEEYIWRTARDLRVVGTPGGLFPKGSLKHGDHYAREGQVFRWDDPPHDGHPGYPINCRCVAEPVIDVDNLEFV